MQNINLITVLLIGIMALPIISGLFMQYSREGVRISLWSLFDNVIFILGILLSVDLTRRIFFDHKGDLFERIYQLIPPHFQTLLYGQDILIYIIAGSLILFLFSAIIRPLVTVFYRVVLNPLADGLYSLLSAAGPILRGLTGALVQVPRAAFSILVVGLILNFSVYYFPSPLLSTSMNDSGLYQILYQDVFSPVLNSNLGKKIPVIVNDAFAQTAGKQVPGSSMADEASNSNSEPSAMTGQVIEYFNGVTLDTAVKSSPQIDQTALQVVGNERDSRKKAYFIYQWVAANISYDYDKAAKIASDPSGTNSGSIVAFTERQGVCFDYSCLYVSMCRAVGLDVRLLTGQAFSGTTWGDHAWNQVYLPEEDRWANVDPTFGSTADYFDKPDFIADHRYAEVQGEW